MPDTRSGAIALLIAAAAFVGLSCSKREPPAKPSPPSIAQQGGHVLIYEFRAAPEDLDHVGARAADAIRRRLDPDGSAGVTCSHTGDRIDVRIPRGALLSSRMSAKDAAQWMVGRLGVLEFRVAAGPYDLPNEAEFREALDNPARTMPEGYRWFPIDDPNSWVFERDDLRRGEALVRLNTDPGAYIQNRVNVVAATHQRTAYILLSDSPGGAMTHEHADWGVESVRGDRDETGRRFIAFELNKGGAELLGPLTASHVGRSMAILVDGRVLSAPHLNSGISRSGLISGDFSEDEITRIVSALSAPLPVPVTLVETRDLPPAN